MGREIFLVLDTKKIADPCSIVSTRSCLLLDTITKFKILSIFLIAKKSSNTLKNQSNQCRDNLVNCAHYKYYFYDSHLALLRGHYEEVTTLSSLQILQINFMIRYDLNFFCHRF